MTDTDQSQIEKYPSPCIGLCRLDENDVCLGCYRARDELFGWAARSDEEKKAILERCAQRTP